MDTFLSITSTKSDLESTSFLSSLDMDPGQSSTLAASNFGSPSGSRVNLLAGTGGEGILAALTSPPLAGGLSGSDTPPREQPTSKFSDFRRFMTFAVRRDSMQPHP